MAMHLPEAPQGIEGGIGQRHETIAVALGVPDVHPSTLRIDIADLQRQPFTETQAQAVQREIEHPVAQLARGRKQALRFIDADDVGQALRLGRLDQMRHDPGLAQDMNGIELEAVEIELDRAPGVRGDQVGEVVGQLGFGQVVDAMREIRTHATYRAGIGIDGLGLQALELEVLEMGLVLPVEVRGRCGLHAGLST